MAHVPNPFDAHHMVFHSPLSTIRRSMWLYDLCVPLPNHRTLQADRHCRCAGTVLRLAGAACQHVPAHHVEDQSASTPQPSPTFSNLLLEGRIVSSVWRDALEIHSRYTRDTYSRYTRDTLEIHSRCTRDALEMYTRDSYSRCTRDALEMHSRYTRDALEMHSRCREMHSRCTRDALESHGEKNSL